MYSVVYSYRDVSGIMELDIIRFNRIITLNLVCVLLEK